MSEPGSVGPPQGGLRGFWNRQSKIAKAVLIAVVVIVALTIIGALIPEDKKTTVESTDVTETTRDQTEQSEPETTEPEEQVETVTGKVAGTFKRDCLVCEERLVRFIKTSNVWCGWRGDALLVHVTMRNTSVEHLTVNWHPSYIVARGGEHGAGLGSIQSNGFDGDEVRSLTAEQHPEGVPIGAKIATCKPSFSVIESG